MKNGSVFVAAVLFASPSLAQTNGTYLLTSSNTVTSSSPTTTIEIWATWVDPLTQWIFGAGDYDLTAGDGVFSNPVNVLNTRGSTTGVIAGNVISGAVLGQFHLPSLGLIGSRDNPILLATYEWTTMNFTPRTVSLDTSNTSLFQILAWWMPPGLPPTLGSFQLFPRGFTPASGVINVVPAPAAWLVLALPLAAATRRRRS